MRKGRKRTEGERERHQRQGIGRSERELNMGKAGEKKRKRE